MKKTNKWSTAFGVVFVIWFIASMLGLIYFGTLGNGNATLAIFGQYFFVFGLVITFAATPKSKLGIIFVLVGVAILIGTGINFFGTEEIMYIFNEKVIPILLSAVFLLPGLGMLIIPRRIENKKKNRCTFPVEAKCIKIVEEYDGEGGRVYAPVFEFYVGGEVFTYNYDTYSALGVPNIGDTEILYVNPENYSDIYRMTPSIHKKLIAFMGITFTIMGGGLMYIAVSDLIRYIINR